MEEVAVVEAAVEVEAEEGEKGNRFPSYSPGESRRRVPFFFAGAAPHIGP